MSMPHFCCQHLSATQDKEIDRYRDSELSPALVSVQRHENNVNEPGACFQKLFDLDL